ncbi:hypothetical protein HLASF_1143 [Halanaeroarchaeum sulfurireducens]|uniref:Uncharacterized protein n=1 Tax=Halanaeroarchaeum sulfurireducens TaxID=1604004 RepID=A0A0F7P8X8_9EURY|nr:hypothetical protein HLASF_1143 [Halanaeroarchaeum sulfurireducens]ALG82027.1 hypothetical protein HLASA_1132 [Halanaeroarchaeum sulfurireducens]
MVTLRYISTVSLQPGIYLRQRMTLLPPRLSVRGTHTACSSRRQGANCTSSVEAAKRCISIR